MLNKKIWFIAPMLVVAIALVLTGCGKSSAEKAAEKALETATNGQADVDVSENTVKINTNNSSYEAGENVSLPDGFPDDIYLVDGNITAAFTYTKDKDYSISIETSKTVSEVKALYDTELKADGWAITSSMVYEGSAAIWAEKENRMVSVGINKGSEDGKNTVVISASKTDSTSDNTNTFDTNETE
ncbi:MAG: hypothetical protein PHH01_02135 [Patescibacteria group bacterium]|nr:hypothetical protein [Patescibacteria group bacterium]